MERESFLGTLSRQLGRPPCRTAPHRPFPSGPPTTPAPDLGAQFGHELEKVGGRFTVAASAAELWSVVMSELSAAAGPVVSYARSEIEAFGLPLEGFERVSFWGEGDVANGASFRRRALAADVGLTTVDLALASTGTLMLSAARARPRSVSLLPRKHLALVHERQLVPDLPGALAHAPVAASSFYFITGPSRTSDIENDLSIGVHGPAEVHVILWREAAR